MHENAFTIVITDLQMITKNVFLLEKYTFENIYTSLQLLPYFHFTT